MNITIIGWYGTETIGDRGILTGIVGLIGKSYKIGNMYLGSLNPFFSERTVSEDFPLWKKLYDADFEIKIFDSRSPRKLRKAIKDSEWVIIGGGPLMHIDPMHMLEYAFKYARKNGIRTIILGCGIGPFTNIKYLGILKNILKNSETCILRDELSHESLKKWGILAKNTTVGTDPSVKTLIDWRKQYSRTKPEGIAINFRKFPNGYAKKSRNRHITEKIEIFIKNICKNSEEKIKLIPMSYFHVGDDDREFLNEIKMKYPKENIFVQNEPLTLEETMQEFSNAIFCHGMRFHSIVFQTLLNGKNYVFNYTDSKNGKIIGFLKAIGVDASYRNRWVDLTSHNISINDYFYKKPTETIKINEAKANDFLNRMTHSLLGI